MESFQSAKHKCAACFREFQKEESLIEHMKTSFHSQHEPTCDVCKKHCRFYESLREHLTGSLRKMGCAKQFRERGCTLCLRLFRDRREAAAHVAKCRMHPALPPRSSRRSGSASIKDGSYAIALDCQYVGGGRGGSLDVCARVCLVDEGEQIVLDTYIKPRIPVTNYRHDLTGIMAENLQNAMTPKQAQEKIEQILCSGGAVWKMRLKGGKARALVGHNLETHLNSLGLDYPTHLRRDTSKYVPLLKSSNTTQSLKFLTETYLGYMIQRGPHDPYENCVAAMRLYKRMRDAEHYPKEDKIAADFEIVDSPFKGFKQKELEKTSPQELLHMSTSDYYCWCLDSFPRLSQRTSSRSRK